jgi:hypothetical protein
MKYRSILCTVTFVSILLAAPSISVSAGSWLRSPGTGFISVRGTYYSSSQYWDNTSSLSGIDTPYQKGELNLYGEYGVLSRVTAVGMLNAPYISQNDNNAGLGDLGLGANIGITHDTRVVTNLQVLGIVPLHDTGSEPALGYGATGVETNALIGTELTVFGRPAFVDTTTGVRYFFGERWDTFHGSITIGINFTDRMMLLVNTRGKLDTDALGADRKEPKQGVATLGFGPVYSLTDSVSLQAGVDADLWGRNAGQGFGVYVSTWLTF